MFAEAARVGRPVTAEDVCRWGEDALRDLAHEVVQETFDLFRRQLMNRQYDPRRGAALFTYFMNAATRQFPNVYRRRRNARRSFENRVDLRPTSLELDRPDPDDYHASHARFEAMLITLVQGITAPQQRQAAWLYLVHGQSYRHIAEQLRVTPEAARSLVNRARAAMRNVYLRHVDEGKEDGDD
jgi:RNA polymerase sigma factor (sigma-70 family)